MHTSPRDNKRVIFVYNADGALFNRLSDFAHKIISPKTYVCDLCKLTHGMLTEKKQRKEFLDQTDRECIFLHSNEFREEYPDRNDKLPAIYLQDGEKLSVLYDAKAISKFKDIDELIENIKFE